ncbi:hypothetical protein ZIOFF_032916 [Zingiber officinale]|uniref:Fe2OG dioxygenase domain-containing protein n=2 Tax=Zingiber officinale TaxID=94328 RepID=A0A8J5GHK3_ZINOF|nr:hypothetical protein ZIOFF_032916 [Zingiber officinale]
MQARFAAAPNVAGSIDRSVVVSMASKTDLCSWPEPVVSVQSLSDSGAVAVPGKYVKPLSDRPVLIGGGGGRGLRIPVVDLRGGRAAAAQAVSEACREWGFFQVVNHGVPAELVEAVRRAWRGFFRLPLEAKNAYANSPRTYEGFGSRLGVEKDAPLDWGDYYFLNLKPASPGEYWPALPDELRAVTEEYGAEVQRLCELLLGALSAGLGLEESFLREAFGGAEGVGTCMRVNLYPKCPQPELTLGLSPHSDPGGVTVLLADDHVDGLQVRRHSEWVPVRPIAGAFIVNIADQIQVISNAMYKSVEHRVIVNEKEERLSVAFFYNPGGDVSIGPAKEVISEKHVALYPTNTFNEYRKYVREKGPRGKSQVESLKF